MDRVDDFRAADRYFRVATKNWNQPRKPRQNGRPMRSLNNNSAHSRPLDLRDSAIEFSFGGSVAQNSVADFRFSMEFIGMDVKGIHTAPFVDLNTMNDGAMVV